MEKNAYVQSGTNIRKIAVIGFNRRLAATLIDGLILLVGTFMLSIAIGLAGVFLDFYREDNPIPVHTLVTICGLILSLLYYVIAWTKSGQTIAKSVLGIKVVGSTGQPLSIGKAILRYLGYIISAAALSLGFVWIIFDKERQGWHDKIASSYVVDGQVDFYAGKSFEFVPADQKLNWGWLAIWLLIALVMPSALLSSLYILGPTIGLTVTQLFLGLR